MIVQLVLQGRHSKDGLTHATARRIVPVALDIPEERKHVGKFFCEEEGRHVWGLGDGDAWWRIVEAFEVMDPTIELHEHKFPVSYALTESEMEAMIEEVSYGENSLGE